VYDLDDEWDHSGFKMTQDSWGVP